MSNAKTAKRRALGVVGHRALGVVRLSHLTDETLSPEVQRDKIDLTVQARGDKLIHIAEDLDVSGAVSAWNRDLAPWLEEPERIAQWDYIIVAKLDRLTRSILDFQLLLMWCAEHGKTIISIGEGFDLSTLMGKMAANFLIMFAEFERERMSERRSERAQADIARGWWGGGRTKYGFIPVKVDNHYEVIVDPDEKAIAERMALGIFAGKSATQIARELTADEVPTKVGGKWAATTILDILRDPSGVLDTDTWLKLQPIIGAMSRPKNNRYDAAALTGVIFCARCRKPMWGQRTQRRDTIWSYYRCHSEECKHVTKMIRAADLETAADDFIVSEFGHLPHTERQLVAGSDTARLLAEIDRSLTELAAKLTAKLISRNDFRTQQDILFAEQDRLENLPVEPDRYHDVETGLTVAQYWASLDWPAKRQYFTTRGLAIYALAGKRRGDVPTVSIEGGEMAADARALSASF